MYICSPLFGPFLAQKLVVFFKFFLPSPYSVDDDYEEVLYFTTNALHKIAQRCVYTSGIS